MNCMKSGSVSAWGTTKNEMQALIKTSNNHHTVLFCFGKLSLQELKTSSYSLKNRWRRLHRTALNKNQNKRNKQKNTHEKKRTNQRAHSSVIPNKGLETSLYGSPWQTNNLPCLQEKGQWVCNPPSLKHSIFIAKHQLPASTSLLQCGATPGNCWELPWFVEMSHQLFSGSRQQKELNIPPAAAKALIQRVISESSQSLVIAA